MNKDNIRQYIINIINTHTSNEDGLSRDGHQNIASTNKNARMQKCNMLNSMNCHFCKNATGLKFEQEVLLPKNNNNHDKNNNNNHNHNKINVCDLFSRPLVRETVWTLSDIPG